MCQQLANWHPLGFKFLQGTGFQSGPMAFAGQMQIFGFLSLGLLWQESYRYLPRPLRNKFVYYAVIFSNIAGLVFASERSAWLGLIVALAFFLFLLSRQLMIRSFLLMGAAVAAAWFCLPVVQKRLLPLSHWQQDVSVRVRFQLWRSSFELFQSSWLTGVGATKFPHQYIKEAIVPGRSSYLDHAHSNYLQALATTGILGFASYVYLIACIFLVAWREFVGQSVSQSGKGFDQAIALGILSAMVSLSIAGIFEYNFGTGPVRLTQWFVLALLSGVTTAKAKPAECT